MSPLDAAIAALAMFAGGVAAGSVGFGAVIVSAPLVVIVAPSLVPFAYTAPVIAVDVFVAWRERAALDRRLLARLLAWQIPGAAAGAWVLGRLDERALSLAVGSVIIVFVGSRLLPFRPSRSSALEVVAALAAGLSGAITGANGPPLAALLADDDPSLIRATLPAFFALAQVALVVAWSVSGVLDTTAIGVGAAFLPAMLAGGWVGQRLAGRLRPETVRAVVLGLALVAVARALA